MNLKKNGKQINKKQDDVSSNVFFVHFIFENTMNKNILIIGKIVITVKHEKVSSYSIPIE